MTTADRAAPGREVLNLADRETTKYATVYVAEMTVGIDIRAVQEIVTYQEMTPVPLAPAAVAGLINLRGQIVTAIDLRSRLGLPARDEGARPSNVVVRFEERAVSLLVDRIGDVIGAPSVPDPVPETLTGIARGLISGVHQLNDDLLLVLDERAAVTLSVGEPELVGSAR
jgi:purine-binding chemotaxis protein CheW